MIDHIQIPSEFVELAAQWYDGQDDMLYAVASAGNLVTGTIRPWNDESERYCTDDEWYASLYSSLAHDLRYSIRAASRGGREHEDLPQLRAFLAWVDKTEEGLVTQSTLRDKVN